ncbi:MAG: GNAT family N-acetyltransferase [Trichodesmium sp. MAG_R02]|jgi:amino-acid N-acetyltransferase|nr:GNAT family N-acetyltransferase [Trichodesmium sp. MAG_R02]
MTEIVLPNSCNLRPASAKDIWSIRKLVLTAKLDPTQLRWQQFLLIECEGKLVGCGQLRNFEDAQELGSLVVVKPWQKRGLGTTLAKSLIQQSTKPLYLECVGKKLEYFYSRLDFFPISLAESPKSLKFKFGITELGRKIFKIPLIIMEYKGNKVINN